jgi:hypothetical protein
MKRKAHLVLPFFLESYGCNALRQANKQVTVVAWFDNELWLLGNCFGEMK